MRAISLFTLFLASSALAIPSSNSQPTRGLPSDLTKQKTLNRPLIPFLESLPNSSSTAPPYPSSLFGVPSASPPTVLTPIVKKAKEYLDLALPPWSANHCYRTYAFGVAVAEYFGWSNETKNEFGWNKELWFLASVLHDLGWTPDSTSQNGESRLSFELWGAIKARQVLIEWGAPTWVAEEVCEAIARHTELYEIGVVRLIPTLLNLSTLQDLEAVLDQTGLLNIATTRTICELYPRMGMLQRFQETIDQEIGYKPGCMSATWRVSFNEEYPGVPADYADLEGSVEDGAEQEKVWKEKRKGMKWELKD